MASNFWNKDEAGSAQQDQNTYDIGVLQDTLSAHEASTTEHVNSGDVVGTSMVQTLSNKTLTSPNIQMGTITGISSLTATHDLDIGSYQLKARTLASDVATGTAPLTVVSETMVDNLNAEFLNGIDISRIVYGDDEQGTRSVASDDVNNPGAYHNWHSCFWNVNGSSDMPDTGWWWCSTSAHVGASATDPYCYQIAVRNSATYPSMYYRTGNGGVEVFSSWFLVVSTSQSQTLTNKTLTSPDINGGTVDSITSLTASNDLDIGSHNLKAETLESDVATGTAPLTVTSTTVVTNLNADRVDGIHGSSFVRSDAADSVSGVLTFTAIPQFNGGESGVSAPFSVDSNLVVTSLNADLLDGVHGSSFVRSDANDSISGTHTYSSRPAFNGGVSGTSSPFTVDSNTVVTNLNADLLDGVGGGSFLRSDDADSKTAGALTFNDNIYLNIGTGADVEHFWDGSNYYTDINGGANWYIRDGNSTNANRFIMSVDTGDLTCSRLNSTSTATSATISTIMTKNGTDNIVRPSTVAQLKTALGSGAWVAKTTGNRATSITNSWGTGIYLVSWYYDGSSNKMYGIINVRTMTGVVEFSANYYGGNGIAGCYHLSSKFYYQGVSEYSGGALEGIWKWE